MSSNLVINAITFSGTPDGAGNASAWKPTGYVPTQEKIGATLVSANGTRTRVERNAVKRTWKISWERTNTATKDTLKTIAALMTTFSFSDDTGASYTVQVEDGYEPEWMATDVAGNNYWNCSLTLVEH